jgi:hypothetical protein
LALYSELGSRLFQRMLERKDAGIVMFTSQQVCHSVQYGYLGKRLTYAVFQINTKTNDDGFEFFVSRAGKEPNITATLNYPDGKKKSLPCGVTLMQFNVGRYSELDFKVTRAEFESYLKSTSNYSIDSLVKFVTRYREAEKMSRKKNEAPD